MATATPADQELDRRAALVRTFEVVCRLGPLPRGGLRRALGASQSTITTCVQELRERGLVIETGAAESTGGRPARILDLAPDLGGVLAADIGGINLRVAAADMRGRILAESASPTPTTADQTALRQAIADSLQRVRDAISGPVRAVAVAVAGVVDPRTQAVSLAENIPGWHNVELADWVGDFEAPLLVDNEANLAALGEHSQGCAQGAQNVLFVAIGAGIGAGLIVNGQLFRGATGAAGEIGFLRKSLSEPPGDLEQEAGVAALVRRYREHGGNREVDGAKGIFALSADGDAAAAAALNGAMDELAVGIRNAIAIVDPEIVVVGGGVALAGSVLITPLRERLAALGISEPVLVLSELGPHAALVGATSWAAEHARSRLALELERGSVLV